MGATLRARLKKEHRQNLVLQYYLRGWSFTQISEELKVVKSTISKDIKAIREEWRATRADAIGQELLHELARIDAIEREAWAQWESSKVEEVSTRAETEVTVTIDEAGRQIRKPSGEKVVRSTRLRNADPRYLQSVQWCVEQRCKLLGLISPLNKIQAPPAPDEGAQNQMQMELDRMTEEELEVLNKLRDRMLGLPETFSIN